MKNNNSLKEEVLLLKAKHLVALIEHDSCAADRELHCYGEWSCDHNGFIGELNKELEEIFKELDKIIKED